MSVNSIGGGEERGEVGEGEREVHVGSGGSISPNGTTDMSRMHSPRPQPSFKMVAGIEGEDFFSPICRGSGKLDYWESIIDNLNDESAKEEKGGAG